MVDQEMFCRLCLCQPQILIPVLDESGTESQDIVTTVVRYLGLWLTIADRICVTCWASVDNFRKFCALVAERQTQFVLPKESDGQLVEEQLAEGEQSVEEQSSREQSPEQQLLEAQQQLEEQQPPEEAQQNDVLGTNELVARQVTAANTVAFESAPLEYEELANKEQAAVQQLAYGQLMRAQAYESEASTVVAEEQTASVSHDTPKEVESVVTNVIYLNSEQQAIFCTSTEENQVKVKLADSALQHKNGVIAKQAQASVVEDIDQQTVNTTQKEQMDSTVTSTREQQLAGGNGQAAGTVKPVVIAPAAQKVADTNDGEMKADVTVQSNKRQLLRLSNARKLGRPKRSDASVSLEEDRLIASHMQLCCDICTVKISSFDALKRHFKTAHDVNGYVICCKKRLYKRGILIDHINVHRNPAYFTCTLCQNTFADRVCLRNHMLLKHNDVEKSPHQCVHCERKFAKLYFLQRHMIKHADDTSGTFCCDHCQKSYPNSTRLKAHIRNVHSDSVLKVCNHCGERVRGSKSFERHLALHESKTPVQTVQCNVCGQRLSSNYCLRIHMERHEDKREYICSLCGKDAPSRVALNAHMRYYHASSETIHECSVCSRGFKTTRGLREHMTTHTGETLYSCNYCGKRFKCSSNLHAHRKWQHAAEWTRDMQTTAPNACV